MEAMVEEITENVIERQNTKVSATLGYTLNLGNFQSLRVDLGVVDYTYKGDIKSLLRSKKLKRLNLIF